MVWPQLLVYVPPSMRPSGCYGASWRPLKWCWMDTCSSLWHASTADTVQQRSFPGATGHLVQPSQPVQNSHGPHGFWVLCLVSCWCFRSPIAKAFIILNHSKMPGWRQRFGMEAGTDTHQRAMSTMCGKRWRPWVNVKCWIMFTSRWNPNFGSCLWVLNDFGIVFIGTVMASRLNWREGREECGSSCKVCIHPEERHPKRGGSWVAGMRLVYPEQSQHFVSYDVRLTSHVLNCLQYTSY